MRVQKEKEIALLEKITSIQTEKDNEIKAARQMKETIRQLKQANVALKEHAENEVQLTKQERKKLTETLENVNTKYREMQALYAKVGVKVEDSPSDSLKKEDLLNDQIECLKKEISEKELKVQETVIEFESLNR